MSDAGRISINQSDNPEKDFREYIERCKLTVEAAKQNPIVVEVGIEYGLTRDQIKGLT